MLPCLSPQHLAALHHGINAPGAPTVERPQAPPSPPHKPQRRQQGSSLVVGMGEEGRDGANPSSSTASALGAGLGAGAGKVRRGGGGEVMGTAAPWPVFALT